MFIQFFKMTRIFVQPLVDFKRFAKKQENAHCELIFYGLSSKKRGGFIGLQIPMDKP